MRLIWLMEGEEGRLPHIKNKRDVEAFREIREVSAQKKRGGVLKGRQLNTKEEERNIEEQSSGDGKKLTKIVSLSLNEEPFLAREGGGVRFHQS